MAKRNREPQERITGRFACEDIHDADGNVLVAANHMITPKRAALVMSKGVDENGEPLEKVKSVQFLPAVQSRCLCKVLRCKHGNRSGSTGW